MGQDTLSMSALLVLRVSISMKHLYTITPMEVTLPQMCVDLKHNLLHMVRDNDSFVANILQVWLIINLVLISLVT